MSLPATDPFTGANGTALTTYSPSWTLNAGNFNIQTNSLAANGAAAATDCGAFWNADVFPNDQYAQSTIGAVSGGAVNARIGVGVRHKTDGSANFYGLYYDDDANETSLFKFVAGVFTLLGAVFAGVRIATDVLRLEIAGSTLTYKLNGVSQGTRSDATFASGSAGVVGRGLTAAQRIADWEGGSLAVAAAVPLRIARILSPQQRVCP